MYLALVVFQLFIIDVYSDDFWARFFNPRFSRLPKFPEQKFYTVSIGLSSVPGYVGCLGDFNSDRYTDLFIIHSHHRAISVFLWNQDEWIFNMLYSVTTEFDISSCAAADIDYNGELDLLVQGVNETSLENIITWYSGNYETLTFIEYLPSSIGQVMIMDKNSDLRPDLFGAMRVNDTLERYYWINSPGAIFSLERANDVFSQKDLFSNHSHVFADVSGDCLADLVITSHNGSNVPVYDIFSNTRRGFTPSFLNFHGVPGAGQLTLADFNSDGTMDIIFPVCYPPETCAEDNSIHIIYNQQIRVCQSIFDTSCREESKMCDDIYWNLDSFNSTGSGNVVIIPKEVFGEFVFTQSPLELPRLRIGDYNLDGFMDLLVLTTNTLTHAQIVEIWESIPCSEADKCTAAATNSGQRTFKRIGTDVANDLAKITNAFAAFFFDIDEDGNVDIIVLNSKIENNTRVYSIQAIFNNYHPDAYFFKTLGLNGLCTLNCANSLDIKPYGVNQYGATIKFTFDDLLGYKHARTIPQLSQSGYLTLETPYTLNGLGRPANYISYLYLGIPYNSPTTWYYSWSGLIPNSQVVVIPYPPDQPPNWQPELYLTPSGITLWIIVAVIGGLLLLGITVLIFNRREKKQDEEEKQGVYVL